MIALGIILFVLCLIFLGMIIYNQEQRDKRARETADAAIEKAVEAYNRRNKGR